uniref:Succinate dehydrogenase assembly factor 2, mitochondrial n=1 Tax=Heterorhabditis bacteriophora TaxID=37862 RepID=A0A1I7XML5_HETBA
MFRKVQTLFISSTYSKSLVMQIAKLSTKSCTQGHDELSALRARLLYQSKKRGILENDILLGEFAEQNLATMNRSDLESYDQLINGEHMEWDLFYYLSNKKTPPVAVKECTVYQMIKQFVEQKRHPSS